MLYGESRYHININEFLARFKHSKKLDDLFSRGYTLCMDTETEKRAILKFYSTETPDQQQAVLQNMTNFQKLNQIDGICKLLKYAIAESRTELISAFQYDPFTLGELINVNYDLFQKAKFSNMTKDERVEMYLDVWEELIKILITSVEIGIEIDDINRENILVRENPNAHITSSTSSIDTSVSRYQCNVLYDERQKQYSQVQSNQLTQQNGNKIYWSADKIQSQVFRGADYSTQDGEESIYQLGLMLIDIIYELETYFGDYSQFENREQSDLKPDRAAGLSEKRLNYYTVRSGTRSVERNQALVSQRLNYLINSSDEVFKQIGIILKQMTMLMAQVRPNFNKIVDGIHSARQSHFRSKRQGRNNQQGNRNIRESSEGPARSSQSIGQEQIYISSGKTLRNIQQNPNTFQVDSLKYSQNSANFNGSSKINENGFKKSSHYKIDQNYNEPASVNYLSHSLNNVNFGIASQEKINSSQNVMSNSVIQRSINDKSFLSFEELLNLCRDHHEDLRTSMKGIIIELNEIKKAHPEAIIRKQYFDGSIYYGCIDQSNKKRLGLGVYVYKTGDIYFGDWKQNTLTNGIYLFKNGESFEGTVKGGKQGMGIYRYSNGNIYNGNWKDDLKNGLGKMNYPNGACYEGEWMKGKKHGEGTYFYQNGIYFKGAFALGKKYGNGIFVFPGGTKIEGFWDNNHLEGMAKIFYQNGDYYQGNFHMSQKTGQGIYKWEGGEQGEIQYRGEFKKDCLEGYAVIKFRNGETYEGKVKSGKRDGQGTYKYVNGDQFKGEWKNDEKQIGKYIFGTRDEFQGKFRNGQMAFGMMHYANGEVYEGEFQKGERHGVGTYSNKLGQLVHEGHWDNDRFIGSGAN